MQYEATECLKSEKCQSSDPQFWHFFRFFLKNAEHTWGLDNKSTLKDYVDKKWSNKDLLGIIASAEGQKMIRSWNRQRAMGIDDALAALGTHPLHQQILSKFEDLTITTPNTAGFTRIDLAKLPGSYKANSNVAVGI